MAKEPRPGTVKTRLSPSVPSGSMNGGLSPGAAAGLYRAFLLDILDTVGSLPRTDRYLLVHPPDACSWFKEQAGPRFEILPQVGENLSERMVAAFAELFRRGHGVVVMRNSDSPTLPEQLMREALDLLEARRADLVIGPDRSGGYYLVGLRQPRPDLFRGVAMSTTSVLEETLRRARLLKLSVHQLAPWLDVDTPEDLEALRRELDPGSREARALCERTEAFLGMLHHVRQGFPSGALGPGDEGGGRGGSDQGVP